jgi:hypothetical protein
LFAAVRADQETVCAAPMTAHKQKMPNKIKILFTIKNRAACSVKQNSTRFGAVWLRIATGAKPNRATK